MLDRLAVLANTICSSLLVGGRARVHIAVGTPVRVRAAIYLKL